jgi:hypothetical protein
MSPAEADDLAKRIINTWRGGPPLVEWRQELEQMDAGTAGTAYMRLKRTMEHAPSIARFWGEYNALDTRDGGNAINCYACADVGWAAHESSKGDPLYFEFSGRWYSAARPCSCNAGQRAAGSKLWAETPRRHMTIPTPTIPKEPKA